MVTLEPIGRHHARLLIEHKNRPKLPAQSQVSSFQPHNHADSDFRAPLLESG